MGSNDSYELDNTRASLLEERVANVFDKYKTNIAQLRSANLGTSEKQSLLTLDRIHKNGIENTLDKLRSSESKRKIIELATRFCEMGPCAILLAGAQRGGDFLLNQLRGRWAEEVCCSIPWAQHRIVQYGPSGAAMPGEEDHDTVVRSFKEIVLTEGKRPDLLVFDDTAWNAMDSSMHESITQWPMRRLASTEELTLKTCKCGIEVKNSTWHYSTRRDAGGGPLAVTVKDEEIEDLSSWSVRIGKPILFMQVLFDEIYCMSFARMRDAIKTGHLYEPGDYVAEKDRKSQKYYHRFFLNDLTHLCARTVYPDSSEAVVKVLPNGNVIPFIRYSPAAAEDANIAVIENELQY